jgi:hypothetical protein
LTECISVEADLQVGLDTHVEADLQVGLGSSRSETGADGDVKRAGREM